MHGGRAATPLLQALVAAGADPEIATAVGETPLGLALAGDADHARWLHWTGWRPQRRRLRPTDLVAASAAGDLDAVIRLLGGDEPLGNLQFGDARPDNGRKKSLHDENGGQQAEIGNQEVAG